MSQDIYISVQPVTGEDVYVNVSPNLAGVLFVNGRDGIVVLNKSDVGLSNVENVSITGVSGYLQYQIDNLGTGYVSQAEINLLSGLLAQTGSYLYTTITNLSGDIVSNYSTKIELGNTGANLQSQINSLYGSGFLTGVDLSPYYLKNNPSGFITGIDTSNFYTKNNPSGFITGVDLSSYATVVNLGLTGQSLNEKINNLSGVTVLTFGNQIINGTKYFNENVYVHNLYVTGTEFIANVQNNFVESPYILLNLTGGAIDGGIFFVTGAGLTGVNDYGPIIGFDHSNKFKFGIARRSDDLSTLNDIAAVQDITNYSGFVDGNFYKLNNPSGFITGVDLSNYYTNDNPSGFITGIDLSNYVTGNVVRPSETGNFITASQTGNFYPVSNPSGFITGLNVDLSSYATTGQLNQASGNLQSQIDILNVNSIAYAIALG